MIYLDYSATTPLDPRVGAKWLEIETKHFANANSTHAMGQAAKAVNVASLATIAAFFKVPVEAIIPTSSAVEANNFALKGLAMRYPQKRHLIVSALEHASLIGAAGALAHQDLDVDTLPLTPQGLYDLEALETLIRPDTLVVSLTAVDSETGSRQPIEAAAARCRSHGVFFHTDLTQLVGKGSFDLTDVDLATASAHKVYGPKGIGVLIKKPHVGIVPLLHGGHSVTPWRASTPSNGLLAAFAEALRLAQIEHDERLRLVQQRYDHVISGLSRFPQVTINHAVQALPHFVNFSIVGTRPEEGLQYFSDHGVCFSSKSACSGQEEKSVSVFAITGSEALAVSSYRLGLSHLTTESDITTFLKVLSDYVRSL
jgi:cysteine desulfurase